MYTEVVSSSMAWVELEWAEHYMEDSKKCISLRQYINTASKFT